MMKPLERHVRARVKLALKTFSIHRHSAVAGPYSTLGVEDDTVCMYGRYVGIESKVDATKKPTALQRTNALSVVASGGCMLLIHHGNIDAFEEWVAHCHDVSRFVTPPVSLEWYGEWPR